MTTTLAQETEPGDWMLPPLRPRQVFILDGETSPPLDWSGYENPRQNPGPEGGEPWLPQKRRFRRADWPGSSCKRPPVGG
jgi:hypothetical protein